MFIATVYRNFPQAPSERHMLYAAPMELEDMKIFAGYKYAAPTEL